MKCDGVGSCSCFVLDFSPGKTFEVVDSYKNLSCLVQSVAFQEAKRVVGVSRVRDQRGTVVEAMSCFSQKS